MAIQQNFPFTESSNYSFNSSLISVSGGTAQLILSDNTGQTFTENFASSTGFTFSNAGDIEVAAGILRQIDQTPAGETFYAGFSSSINGSRGAGTLTPTATSGSPTVSGGKLNLKGGTTKYVVWDANLNADSQQTGCMRFKVTPNYTGSPSTDQYFLSIVDNVVDAFSNLVRVLHQTSGNLIVNIYDQSKVIAVSQVFAWSPTAGTEYEIELNWDGTAGATRLFIDGVQAGSTSTATFTRSADINQMNTGAQWNLGPPNTPDFEMDDIQIFSTVQHTANYTPTTAQQTTYNEAYADLPAFSYSGLGSVQAYTNLTNTEGGSPQYVIDGQYWNGSAWVASDKSFAQSNPLATVQANIATITATDDPDVTIVFADQDTQGTSDDLTLTYTGQAYSTADPTVKPAVTQTVTALAGFTETSTATGSDSITYTIEVDGQQKYWSGVAWVDSNGTLAQTNTAADVTTNIGTLDLAGGKATRWVAYLHSDDGSTTPNIDEVEYCITFFNPAEVLPDSCIISGYTLDTDGNVLANASVSVLPRDAGFIAAKNFYMPKQRTTVTSAADGFFQIKLIQSAQFDTPVNYDFRIIPSGSLIKSITDIENLVIPASSSADFDELVQGS